MANIPVFVFGTLRVGHGNYRMVEREVVARTYSVATKGKMYYVGGGWGGYPVVDFRENGMVIGDLLYFDVEDPLEWWEEVAPHRSCDYRGLAGAIGMEVGAGYTPAYIEVLTPDRELVKAVAFTWEHRRRGDHIPSGDWNMVKGRPAGLTQKIVQSEAFQRDFARMILREHPSLQRRKVNS